MYLCVAHTNLLFALRKWAHNLGFLCGRIFKAALWALPFCKPSKRIPLCKERNGHCCTAWLNGPQYSALTALSGGCIRPRGLRLGCRRKYRIGPPRPAAHTPSPALVTPPRGRLSLGNGIRQTNKVKELCEWKSDICQARTAAPPQLGAAEEGRRARMGGDVTLRSHKGEPGLFFAETDDISLLNGGCFHFIIFLASNKISRALRVFQKLAGGLWKLYPDPARLALFECEPAPSWPPVDMHNCVKALLKNAFWESWPRTSLRSAMFLVNLPSVLSLRRSFQ